MGASGEMDPALATEAAAMLQHKVLQDAIERGGSDIQLFYENAVIFLTGGSGFCGKHLMEKLLRSTNLKKIFVLIRPKKGKNVQDRLQDILMDPLFENLKKSQPDFSNKIVVVEGDVTNLRLGINDGDRTMISEEVDIIFHMAATTRFIEPLENSTMINVRGTRELIYLAKDCKNLRSFVHVSTAYSHATKDRIKREVKETFYRTPISPDALIHMAEGVDSRRLSDITPGLTKGWPNCYTFVKAVAEDLVRTMGADLPVCIVRPGIVMSAYREPLPGWTDPSTVFGAAAVLVGMGNGAMRVVYADNKALISIVPVDYVTNAVLAVAWETAEQRAKGENSIKIYNVVPSKKNNICWKFIQTKVLECAAIFPSPQAVWAIECYSMKSRFSFNVISWLLHYIPAYEVDSVCWLMGKERRFVKIYEKIYKMSLISGFFLRHYWLFDDKNLEKLYKKMSPVDKIIYNFNIKDLDWNEYVKLGMLGVRKYIIKDELKNTEYGRRKQFWFRVARYIIHCFHIFAISSLPGLLLYYSLVFGNRFKYNYIRKIRC